MNCEAGKRAIIIKSANGAVDGKVVTCIRYHGKAVHPIPGFDFAQDDLWEVDSQFITSPGIFVPYFSDAWMRKLPDDPDEGLEEKHEDVSEQTA